MAAAIALALFAVANLGQATVATAAPPVLSFTQLAASDSSILAQLSANAREQASRASDAVQYESWSAILTPDSAKNVYFVQPEEVTLVRDERNAGEMTVRAGQLRWGQPPAGQHASNPGEVLRTSTYREGEFPRLFQGTPPTNASQMKEYLKLNLQLDSTASAGEYFNAVRDLRSEWDLTGAQTAAVIDMLAVLPEVEVAGSARDRLGRDGIALVTSTRSGGSFRDILMVDARTGALLTSEVEYLGGLPEVSLPYPSVLTYIAWKEVRSE